MVVLGSGSWYTLTPQVEDTRKKIPLMSSRRDGPSTPAHGSRLYTLLGVVTLIVLFLGTVSVGFGKINSEPTGAVTHETAPTPDLPSHRADPGPEPEVLPETAAPVTPEISPEAPMQLVARAESPEKEPASRGVDRTFRMLATAYTLECGNGDGYTATMTRPRIGIIAVDPRVIPYGYLVYIEGYGYFRAEDTGGDIKGDRIDIFMLSRADAMTFGRRWVDVKVIGAIPE